MTLYMPYAAELLTWLRQNLPLSATKKNEKYEDDRANRDDDSEYSDCGCRCFHSNILV